MNKQNNCIVVGAGPYVNNPGWVHYQEEELNLLKSEDWSERFLPSSLSVILAEHVWEHLTYDEGVAAAKICHAYLKPGGRVRCAVPDGFFPNEEYQRIVQVGGPGPADHPAASHKIVHNYRSLKSMFESAGFAVQLLEHCDEAGEFHFEDWDPALGVIFRSLRFDTRNADGQLRVVSLIVDAVRL